MVLAAENITEIGLIGSLLVDPSRMLEAVERVKPTDFSDEKASVAFSTMVECWRQKQPVDIVSLSSKHPDLLMYFAKATESAYPPNVAQLSSNISENARLRRVRTGIEAILRESQNASDTLSQLMAIYQAEAKSGKKAPDIKSVLKRADAYTAEYKKAGRYGISTGFDFYESLFVRFIPGHIWTIGAFTSVGKTATMIQLIRNMLSSGKNHSIVIISTEMTEEQVVARLIANFTGVHSMRILSGNYRDAEEQDRVERCKQFLAGCRLKIHDDIYQLEEIENAFRKAELQGGVDVGFIDYVQNCKWSQAKSQYQEQSEMAKRLQALAKDVRATLVCLSQVSNDVGRGNTDQLELKGAGEWAAVSDVSIMLRRNKEDKYKMLHQLKKNRHGALGEMHCSYMDDFTRIEEE